MRSEGGFTVVEAMVAGLILVIGGLGLLGVVDAATRGTYRAEQSQVLVNRLQEELEAIRRLPYAEVALTAAPATSADPDHPDSRVSADRMEFTVVRGGAETAPLAYDGAAHPEGGTVGDGAIAPSASFASGDVSGTLHRYVVWEDDESCPETECPGAADAKRVIVAATLDDSASGGERAYQELQAEIADPDALPNANSAPPGDPPPPDPWSFWLTDTPCSNTTRQAVTSDHDAHNTMGRCADGVATGTVAGAPDLIYTEAPPLDDAYPADDQPLFDFATDVEPVSDPDLDHGLQMPFPDPSAGCTYELGADAGAYMHRWVSPRIPDGYQIDLDGEAHLFLWTQTLNDAVHPGALCIWIFRREVDGSGTVIDTFPSNPNGNHFEETSSTWPYGGWHELTIPMSFDGTDIPLGPDDRLGLAISVKESGTSPGQALQFMYDHPSFESKLEVTTSSVLPAF